LACRLLIQELKDDPKTRQKIVEGLNGDLGSVTLNLMNDLTGSPRTDQDFGRRSREAGARLARMSPENFDREIKTTNDYFRSLLSLGGMPFQERARKVADLSRSIHEGAPLREFLLLPNAGAVMSLAASSVRDRVYIRAAETLIAIRRWELMHRSL